MELHRGSGMSETLLVIISILLFLMLLLIVFLSLHFYKNEHHSILKLHPYLGRMRYLLEKIGPEFRQYWFDRDTDGKPFHVMIFKVLCF